MSGMRIGGGRARVGLLVNGWQDSPFGAGWWIAGVERLLSVTGGQLVIRGDGSPLFFQQSGGAYLSPPGEYSVLTAVGSSYKRTLPGNRITVWYASTGYVDSIVELQPNNPLVARYYWRPNANPNLSRFLDSIVDPVGRAIRFTYGGGGQLSQILIPGAQPVTLVGTMNGPNTRFRLDSIADPDGYQHGFTYDADYRMLTSQGRATGPVRYTYDPASRLDSIILPAGASAMQHRSWQRLGAPGTGTSGQESNPAVPVLTSAGALTAQAAQLRNGVPEVANFTLDDHQRVAQYALPASAFGTVTRNAAGHPTLITRNDAVWVQTWDAQGLLRRIVQVEHGPPTGPPNARDSAVTTIDYHATWRAPTVVTSPTNAVTQFAYDAYGRRTSVTDPTGLVVSLFYNNRGQPDSIKEAGQDTATVYTYSAATGNLTSVRDALVATTYLYDATWGSDVIRVEGSAGQVTTYTYDGIKRPDVVTQIGSGADSSRVQNYDYDDATRVTSLSTNHRTATWTRDAAGRLTQHCVAPNACDTYNYWGDGINPSNVVLRGGKQVYFLFDAAGRMTERSYGGNPWNTETYQYDASGNLTQAVNAVSRVNRLYDPYGRLKSESQAIRKWADTTAMHTVTAYHAYDRAGRRRVTWLDRTVTMVVDSFLPCPEYCLWENYQRLTASDSIIYSYDQASNLDILRATLWRRTSSPTPKDYWDFNYDARHRLTELKVPLRSGSFMVLGTNVYDNDGRMVEYHGLNGVVTAVDYDPAGRPLEVVVGGLSSTYEYNVLGELKARTGTIGNPEAYTYDAGGNRRTDLMTTYTYNNRDQLTGSNSTACGQATYNYDASGNLWRQTPAIYCSAVDYREMLYDGLNRLTWSQTEKSVPGGIQTETRDFWYDALGRRILAMTVDSGGEGEPPRDWGVWRYWWLDNQVAVKTHNHPALPDWNWPSVQRVSGTLTSMGTWYIHGPGVDNPLASWGYTSLGGGYSDTTQHLYFQDWRGSVTDVRDANGANAGWASNQFTAYGAGGGQGDLGVAPGYNGLESNGGLVYMRNRWYDPNAGRFTQEDPIGYAGGINLYGYVGNNPVSFSDPFGLKVCFKGTDEEVDELKTGTEDATGTKISLDKSNCVSSFEATGEKGFEKLQERFSKLVEADAVYGVRFGVGAEAWRSNFDPDTKTAIIFRSDFEGGFYRTGNAFTCGVFGGLSTAPYTLGSLVTHELLGHGTGAHGSASIRVENEYHAARGQPSRCTNTH